MGLAIPTPTEHAVLDRAVWDAYGWPDDEVPADVEEDGILGRQLALNSERAEMRKIDARRKP